jgi:ABC-type branched-subunit amino acid transport system substrate-binding protein
MRRQSLAQVPRSKRSAILACAAATSLVLAACGSSSPSSSSSGSSSKAPIVVDGIAGVVASGLEGFYQGFEARLARTNAAGGVDGHKIVFKRGFDDQFSNTMDQQDVSEAILQDHVFAIAPVATPAVTPATLQFLKAHDTPMIGFPFGSDQCGSPYFLPGDEGGCPPSVPQVGGPDPSQPDATIFAQITHQPVSSLRVAVLGFQSATGTVSTEALCQLMRQEGAKVVWCDDPVPFTGVTDFTPYAQSILATHPNFVLNYLSFAGEVGIDAALEASGFPSREIVGVAGVPSDIFTTDPSAAAALSGGYQFLPAPGRQDNTPASQQELADLQKAGAFDSYFSNGIDAGYWNADVFVSMLEAVAKTGPLTQSRFVQYISSGKYTYVGPPGSASPYKFPAAENAITAPCDGWTKVDASTKQVVTAYPLKCWPVTVLKGPLPGLIH